MATYGYIFATVFYVLVSLNSVTSVLQCWRCSSDATNGEFCGDPFQLDSISRQQRDWSYVNCSYPYSYNSGQTQNIRPVCKKSVQEIYGKTVISRSCFWEDVNDEPDKCYRDTNASYIKTLYCRTCATDGCNGAKAIVPISAIVLILTLLAKHISL